MIERHTVPLPGGKLALVLHLPDTEGAAPAVVACHGLRASKDSDKYLLLGSELPRAGLALARFDFRGAGESSGTEEETTVATRIEDLSAVLAWLESHPRVDGRLGLLGSSLGGFIALHVAAVRGDGLPVVTWNAPATLSRLADLPPDSGIGKPFRDELAAGRRADAPRGVRAHLVIQAAADEVVPAEHGQSLYERAADPRAIIVIPAADHRLTDPTHRRQATAHSRAWLLHFLSSAQTDNNPFDPTEPS